MNPSLLRRLPSVDALMEKALAKGFDDLYGREQTVKFVQRVLKKTRRDIIDGRTSRFSKADSTIEYFLGENVLPCLPGGI